MNSDPNVHRAPSRSRTARLTCAGMGRWHAGPGPTRPGDSGTEAHGPASCSSTCAGACWPGCAVPDGGGCRGLAGANAAIVARPFSTLRTARRARRAAVHEFVSGSGRSGRTQPVLRAPTHCCGARGQQRIVDCSHASSHCVTAVASERAVSGPATRAFAVAHRAGPSDAREGASARRPGPGRSRGLIRDLLGGSADLVACRGNS